MEIHPNNFQDFDLTWETTHFSPYYYWYKFSSVVNRTTLESLESSSTNAQDFAKFLVEGIGILVVAILGTVGNLLSAWILSRPKMKSSINCLLLGLALTDTLFILNGSCILSVPRFCLFYTIDLIKSPFSIWIPCFYAIGITSLWNYADLHNT